MSANHENEQSARISHLLLKLSVPAHRIGYLQLCTAIAIFQQDKRQTMVAELYPAVAKELGYPDWRAIEHAIRAVVKTAWKRRNPAVWDKYFPGRKAAPSNKQFIATLAEYI